jgi:hypothetical protein
VCVCVCQQQSSDSWACAVWGHPLTGAFVLSAVDVRVLCDGMHQTVNTQMCAEGRVARVLTSLF